jgi:hypothetical protein
MSRANLCVGLPGGWLILRQKGETMFFLIRFAIKFCFWMFVVSLFMPSISGDKGTGQPGPIEAFLAAQETISDLSGFCTRKPQACETGKAALSNAGERAGEVAKVGYEYLGTQFGKNAQDPDAAVAAAHADTQDSAQSDKIKAKLREIALREIIDAASKEQNESAGIDKGKTGTVLKNQ